MVLLGWVADFLDCSLYHLQGCKLRVVGLYLIFSSVRWINILQEVSFSNFRGLLVCGRCLLRTFSRSVIHHRYLSRFVIFFVIFIFTSLDTFHCG